MYFFSNNRAKQFNTQKDLEVVKDLSENPNEEEANKKKLRMNHSLPSEIKQKRISEKNSKIDIFDEGLSPVHSRKWLDETLQMDSEVTLNLSINRLKMVPEKEQMTEKIKLRNSQNKPNYLTKITMDTVKKNKNSLSKELEDKISTQDAKNEEDQFNKFN